MPASRSAVVEVSNTRKVLDALIAADDFLSLPALTAAAKVTTKAAKTSLGWLRHIKAVDSVDSGGTLYWYATPESDQRLRTIDAHRKEDEPRQQRRGRRTTKE